ncbi:MAG: hypothetical protein WD469_10605 [Paenibacillaceae bacterium]
MSVAVSKEEAKKWIGQKIDAVKKDGSVVTGKLVRIKGSKLIFAAEKGKVVQTKALIPLVLFDLLAIGTAGTYGGYGGYYGGYPGYGVPGYGVPGYGVPGYVYTQPFFW